MTRGPEAKLQDKCRDYAKANGWGARKVCEIGRRGFPDFLFAKKVNENRCPKFLVEFKKIGEEATVQQRLRHAQLRNEGWRVYVVDDFEDFKNVLAQEETYL